MKVVTRGNAAIDGESMETIRALSDLSQRLGIAERLGETFGGDRDLYTTFGYRKNPSFDDYLSYYLRGDVAAKVIDLAPRATWRHAPEIRSDNEKFVEQISELDDRVRLFHFMQRVDEISGIGEFGILLLGTRGSKISEEPGKLSGPEDLVYVKAFHQGSVEIKTYEDDQTSPRFGLPLTYEIDLQGKTSSRTSPTTVSKTTIVPWQRVIHVGERYIEDEVHGQPRLARVLNRIDDLQKVIGASAELYWQNIGGVWHADLAPEVKVKEGDMQKFEDDILAARHGLSRLIQTRGVTLTVVAGKPTDPTGTVDALKEMVSAGSEIPQRVLYGSERGQLAGDQDQKEWQARIAAREELHAEPVILRPTIDRLVLIGALENPNGYTVDWPPLDSPSTEDRADVAQKFADAISKVAPEGAGDLVMPIWEFREKILGLDPVPPPMPKDFILGDGFDVDDGDGGDGGSRLQDDDE